MSKQTDKFRIALFLSSMSGGGVERLMLNLAQGFRGKGMNVELVLANAVGPCMVNVPKGCSVVDLGVKWGKGDKRVILALPALARYLSHVSPDVLIAAPGYSGIIALLAKQLVRAGTRVLIIVDVALSQFLSGKWHERLLVLLARYWYRHADAIIASYPRAAKELIEVVRAPADRVRVIYSPFVTDDMLEAAKTPPDHPWFHPGNPPVVLGVGRLVKEKDFALLIRAFAEVRSKNTARLVILGDGIERRQLEKLVDDLHLSEEVALLGFVINPYSYMAKASVLVLPSRREAFGGVLIEAMALGTPVVAIDSPTGGPRDILEKCKYGMLVEAGDLKGLAKAINETIEVHGDMGHVRERVQAFSVESAIRGYMEIINRVTHQCTKR